MKFGIVCCFFVLATLYAWSESTVWDGIYTEEQAQTGQASYAKQCVSCHRAELQGHGQTPSLAGDGFKQKWDGQPLGDLFEKMQASMPADHPGSLSRDENADILAYMLRFNGFPAGAEKLRSDGPWLAGIRFKATKPN